MNEILQGVAAASLAKVTTDGSGMFVGRYCFPASFAGFAGHFPGHPILPAIVEIMIVVSLVGEQTGRKQRLVAVEDAKFLKPVLPDQELAVRCQLRTVKGKLLYDAQLSVEGATTASMQLELADYGEMS